MILLSSRLRSKYIYFFFSRKNREARKYTTETRVHVNKRNEKSFKSSVSERRVIQKKKVESFTGNMSSPTERSTDPF